MLLVIVVVLGILAGFIVNAVTVLSVAIAAREIIDADLRNFIVEPIVVMIDSSFQCSETYFYLYFYAHCVTVAVAVLFSKEK